MQKVSCAGFEPFGGDMVSLQVSKLSICINCYGILTCSCSAISFVTVIIFVRPLL